MIPDHVVIDGMLTLLTDPRLLVEKERFAGEVWHMGHFRRERPASGGYPQ
jgi:hypothetical protein